MQQQQPFYVLYLLGITGGLIRSSHVDIQVACSNQEILRLELHISTQESAVITVYNASVSNSGGLFTGDRLIHVVVCLIAFIHTALHSFN